MRCSGNRLLACLALLLGSCGTDPKVALDALTVSFQKIPEGTKAAKNAAGFGATVQLFSLGGNALPGVPLSAVGGVDLARARTGTQAKILTDMDGDGRAGTGPEQSAVTAFSDAEADFLAYAHPYLNNRAVHALAWQVGSDAYLAIDDPTDPYVTVCTGPAGAEHPASCTVCSTSGCGSPCNRDDPLACGSPPKATDGGN